MPLSDIFLQICVCINQLLRNLLPLKSLILLFLIFHPLVQMRFYFHMSGDGIGTLSVFSRSGGHLRLLWNLTGDQGNYWQMREIPLSHDRDFQVVFEGKVGRSAKGDICVDDITFSAGCMLSSSVEDDTPLPPAGRRATFSLMFCA